MNYTYDQMRDFLKSRDTTHEEMQKRWDSLKESNWKVKNLSEHGKNWTDLTEPSLDSLIKLTREDKEKNDDYRQNK